MEKKQKQDRLHVGSFRFNPPRDPYFRPGVDPANRNPYFEWQYYAVGYGHTEREALEDLLDKIRASGFVVDRRTTNRIRTAYGPCILDQFLPQPAPSEPPFYSEWKWRADGTFSAACACLEPEPSGFSFVVIYFAWNAREAEARYEPRWWRRLSSRIGELLDLLRGYILAVWSRFRGPR